MAPRSPPRGGGGGSSSSHVMYRLRVCLSVAGLLTLIVSFRMSGKVSVGHKDSLTAEAELLYKSFLQQASSSSSAFSGQLSGSAGPDGRRQTPKHRRTHAQNVILQSNASYWGRFQHTSINVTTQGGSRRIQQQQQPQPPPPGNNNNNNQSQETTRLDMTRNLPRIKDFLTTSHPPTANANPQLTSSEQPQSKQQQQQQTKEDRMNIVLLYADDWTYKVLGATNPEVQTPNLDQLAAEGLRFTHNCVTSSICWISRNTLATGVYSSIHQNIKPSSTKMFNETLQWNQTLFPLLKQHGGYYTGLIGKWHAPLIPEFMKQAFNITKVYYGKHWMERNQVLRHVTDLNGEDALKFLQSRPTDQPFFLKLSFYATHAWDGVFPPYQPMNQTQRLFYVNDTIITKPRTATDLHYQRLPWFLHNPRNEGRKRWQGRFDDAHYQSNIKNLYRMATEVDAVIGAVVQELQDQGVYDNTMILFTTDNGNLHGEHGMSEKWMPWEESIRVPLVIRDPRMPVPRRGTTNDDFTLNVDLAPTILSAAQIPVPSFMQGRDLAQLYLHDSDDDDRNAAVQSSWRQDFFYEWNTGHPHDGTGHIFNNGWIPAVFALIRKDYKYYYWPEHRYEQLFHVEQDPYEEEDIRNATTTHQALTLMQARYQFQKAWAQAGNPV